jgi:cytochrome c biogenesis protein CcmG/thiol:disulfide interchange protein DsbE
MKSHLLNPVSLFLLLVALSCSIAAQESPDTPVKPPEHKPLTSLPKTVLDAELIAADGSLFKLSDYSGKVFVLNLWATWCGPCRFETPALVELHKQFKGQGVEIVELSTENPEVSAEQVQTWVHRYGVNYRVGWAPPDLSVILMQGRDAIPQSFVISRAGRIVRRFVGFNKTDTPSLLKVAIQEALDDESKLPEQD